MSDKLAKKNEINNHSNILDGLNEEQRRAVTAVNGPLLIVAGAGSGKTRTLTHRIAYMLEQGISPRSILALTFTNKAAKEMKNRIANITAPDVAEQVTAGTFHSIFARLLRYDAERIGYTSSFSIYDTDDSLSTIKKAMESLMLSQKDYHPASIRSRISSAKNNMIRSPEYIRNAETLLQKQTGIVFEDYERRLREANAMDFDDLLLNFIALLQSDKEILIKYQNRFRYILVDEYQDTNRAQYTAVNLLAKQYQNICVVGDDAQSIYRWRGADIRNILDFQKDYPHAKVFRLEQNYRSTKTIISAAGAVISNNKEQLPKNLWTDNVEGDKVTLLQCADEKNEVDKIASIIKRDATDGLKYKDFAVLYRTNAQASVFEQNLVRYNIPYNIVGGMSFFKRREIKETLCYLRILINPSDNESFLKIVNEPPRGLGDVSLKHLRDFAENSGVSLYEAFLRAEHCNGLQQRAINSARNFAYFLKEYIDKAKVSPDAQLIIKYMEGTGLLQMYKEVGTKEYEDRWNNIQQLLSDISTFYRNADDASLADYLHQISLLSDVDETDLSNNKVSLMTLHSAKGLEFPVVFLAGMEQGLFPLAKADMDPEEMAEERRLFYVGVTRAEQRLYISYAQQRMRFGSISYQSLSDFVKEIPDNLIRADKKKQNKPETKNIIFSKSPFGAGSFTVKAASGKTITIPAPAEPEISFKVGDTVRHLQFGKGKITGLSGEGVQRQAVVNFNSIGKKKLMLAYAKLEKI